MRTCRKEKQKTAFKATGERLTRFSSLTGRAAGLLRFGFPPCQTTRSSSSAASGKSLPSIASPERHHERRASAVELQAAMGCDRNLGHILAHSYGPAHLAGNYRSGPDDTR